MTFTTAELARAEQALNHLQGKPSIVRMAEIIRSVSAAPVAQPLAPSGAVKAECKGMLTECPTCKNDMRKCVRSTPSPSAEVARDAVRLDFIEKNSRSDPKMDGQHVWWPTAHKHALRGPTLRDAIDNAIKLQAPAKEG